MSEIALFFVRFPDKSIYAAGPQLDAEGKEIPGGPMAYEDKQIAQQVADIIGGDVIERPLSEALERCQRQGIVLWIRYFDGGNGYVAESVPPEGEEPQGLVRIEGPEREALIELANQQRGR